MKSSDAYIQFFKKTFLTTLSIGISVYVGILFAANITTLTQTVSQGDKITSTWVNLVNQKLSTAADEPVPKTPNVS